MNNSQSKNPELGTADVSGGRGYERSLRGLRPMLADGAPPVAIAVTGQHVLLAGIETRLAQEVRDLASALIKFSNGTQAIRKELPLGSDFGQLITLFLGTSSLQLAVALLKGEDLPLQREGAALYLEKLGLSLGEFFKQIELDGRRFLAVALVEQSADQVLDHRVGGAGTGNQ